MRSNKELTPGDLAGATPAQRTALMAYLQTGSTRAAAERLGINERSVREHLAAIRKRWPGGVSHETSKPAEDPDAARFEALLAAVKQPIPFADLCDTVGLTPKACRDLVAEARDLGYRIEAMHDHVGIAATVPTEARSVTIEAPVGQVKIAVVSDIHAGSKYTLLPELREFIQSSYDEGIRTVLIPGDLTDGCYRHGLWELTHHGASAQAEALYDALPMLDGLTYHAITGNHDETFTDASGQDYGHGLVSWFAAPPRQSARDRRELSLPPRHDLIVHGDRAAKVRLGGAVIDMWHPKGGQAYSKSYRLQKRIEAYAPGHKPHIALVGHLHQFCYVEDRGVHGFLCPTFQGPGSAFSNSLPGGPTVGGLILEWTHTAAGTIRDFGLRLRRYFDEEPMHAIDTDGVVE